MNIDRRRFMKLSGSALAAAAPLLAPAALADKGIPRLRITEPFGNPSIIWKMVTTLKPGLQARLNCGVETQTITGDDGLAALKAMLAAPSSEVCLFGGNIMVTQYIGATAGFDIPIDTLRPIAKLSNGFSVAVFAKRGGRFESWADVVKASKEKPVALRTPQRNTASSIAWLMIERWAALPFDARKELPFLEIIPEIVDGRIDIGIMPTAIVARQPDLLSCLVTFGAGRSAVFPNTPTFAEITGNRKLSFTESVGILGAPGLAADTAATLTDAFIAAGKDPDIMDNADLTDFPLVVNDADILRQTMERNRGVLKRLLG
jgi:tripartite-type tricarboxylate transporter receptor subunit TctC